jgi:hypothetical protein
MKPAATTMNSAIPSIRNLEPLRFRGGHRRTLWPHRCSYSLLPPDMPDIAADLDRVQPGVSRQWLIRGRLAIEGDDLAWLQERLHHYHEEVRDRSKASSCPGNTANSAVAPGPLGGQESGPAHGAYRTGGKDIPWFCQDCAT